MAKKAGPPKGAADKPGAVAPGPLAHGGLASGDPDDAADEQLFVQIGGGGVVAAGGVGVGGGPPRLTPGDAQRVIERGREPAASFDDKALDVALRPRSFVEFVGQRRVVDNLSLYVEATRRRNRRQDGRVVPLDHVLLTGLPGLGKTTLAYLIAREIGQGIRATSGPAIEKPGDLAGVLTNLAAGEVLFIDEIHRLPAIVEEYLYQAMTDFEIDIVIDQGPAARSIKIDLKPFTLVGATTREGLLSAPFRSRFGVIEKLEPYEEAELCAIVTRSAGLLGVGIGEDAAGRLAGVSRGTPRIANRFLRRMRDVAEVRGDGSIDQRVVDEGLSMLGVDPLGLDATDRRIIAFLCQQGGEPVGLKTIAVAVGEDEATIEDVYEPFLIRKGLLLKTPRGRRPSRRAFEHLSLRLPPGLGAQGTLLDL